MNELLNIEKDHVAVVHANRAQISDIGEMIKNGEIDPIRAMAVLKEINAAVDAVLKDPECIDALKNELAKYPKGEEPFGVKVTQRTGGAMYDYSADSIYAELSDKLKERKAILDTVTKAGKAMVDADTAEQIDPLPVKGYRKDSITIKSKF